jgi:hypothetical protein
MLNLPNVTICAIDSVQPDKAKAAIERSKRNIEFGGELFIDHMSINSRQAYSKFVLQELHKYIKTDFVLMVQWDGWVIDASAWHPTFLDYDYIGAVWPWHPEGLRVGNGGFSLRSKKLLELTAEPKFVYKDLNEDDLICHVNRDYLVSNGVKFAPEELARYFSFEREVTNLQTFGFHGEFHMGKYL